MVVPALQSAPGYFQRNGFACPTDTKDGLVQHALRTKKTSFEYIMSDPLLLRDFNLFMGNGMGARKSWLDWYPVQSEILDGADADPDKVLIVDVGGGKGHDLIAFHKKFPSARRLILEDLPAALDDLGEYSMVIEKIGHDFLTEDQPVKGTVFFPLLFFPFFTTSCRFVNTKQVQEHIYVTTSCTTGPTTTACGSWREYPQQWHPGTRDSFCMKVLYRKRGRASSRQCRILQQWRAMGEWNVQRSNGVRYFKQRAFSWLGFGIPLMKAAMGLLRR
jgi:hypothetical protein